MTNEQTLELIRSYLDDIKELQQKQDLTVNEKQHLKRAYATYSSLYTDAEQGKIDPDFVHENIASFMYVLQ